MSLFIALYYPGLLETWQGISGLKNACQLVFLCPRKPGYPKAAHSPVTQKHFWANIPRLLDPVKNAAFCMEKM